MAVGLGAAVMSAFGAGTATAIAAGAVSSIVAGVIGGAIIGAAIGGLTAAITGGDIGKGLLFGAVGGAVAGGISGALGGASSGSVSGVTASGAPAGSPGGMGAASASQAVGSSESAMSALGSASGSTSGIGSLGSALGDSSMLVQGGTNLVGKMMEGSAMEDMQKDKLAWEEGQMDEKYKWTSKESEKDRQNLLERAMLTRDAQKDDNKLGWASHNEGIRQYNLKREDYLLARQASKDTLKGFKVNRVDTSTAPEVDTSYKNLSALGSASGAENQPA